jgi:hypothetical protein
MYGILRDIGAAFKNTDRKLEGCPKKIIFANNRMARTKLIIPIIALVACLLVRDVVACLNYIPGYFIFAEILEDKECSSKGDKESKKETDESKITHFLDTTSSMLVSAPAIPIIDELNDTSLPYEILYPPPNKA